MSRPLFRRAELAPESAPSTAALAPASKARSAAVDAIRIIGIIAIVAGHTWADEGVLRPIISSLQVPTFFLLTGFLWSFNRGFRTDVAARSRSLMRPYFVWLAIIGVPLVIWQWSARGLSMPNSTAHLLAGVQLGRPFSAFWFVAALFVAGVFVRACEALSTWATWTVVLGALGLSYVFGEQMAKIPYSIGAAIPCVLFVLVGQQLKLHRSRIPRPGIVGSALVLTGTVLIVTHAATAFDIKYGDFGRPAVSVIAAVCIGVAIVLLAEVLAPLMSDRTQKVVVALGSVGLVVLLAHAAVLFLTDSLFEWPLWVCFSLALMVPWALGLVLVRTRYGPWLVGRRYQPPVLARSGKSRPSVA